ncbi:MAG: galactose-1-phosphate uridylyltransferase [Candidatus Margulisiibacteriota bacterium]
MPELRQNPATKEWVIIATERAKRPEDFTPAKIEEKVEVKNHCPFCEGNEASTPSEILAYRTYGTKPDAPGWWIRIIPNKFPALIPRGGIQRMKQEDFFRYMDGVGEHEIIIESPKHDESIATMDPKQVEEIFLAYRERYITLSQDPRFEMVIIFKNHGAAAGTSVLHPHSQVIATPITPLHIRHRLEEAMRYFDDNGTCVFCDMVKKEIAVNERIVFKTENFISFVPFAASSPFLTIVIPKNHYSSFETTTPERIKELSYLMKTVLTKIYTSMKNPDFNFVIRSSPCHEKNVEYYHWHIEIVPRVTAVAGFELGSGIYINTVIPEQAARFLREA